MSERAEVMVDGVVHHATVGLLKCSSWALSRLRKRGATVIDVTDWPAHPAHAQACEECGVVLRPGDPDECPKCGAIGACGCGLRTAPPAADGCDHCGQELRTDARQCPSCGLPNTTTS